jgi:hypothetical protein
MSILKKQLSAGDIIEARCTKCRDILNHRIVAMVGDKVARVECNTCNGVHNYHAPPTAKEAKAPRVATVKSTSGTARKTSTGSTRQDPTASEREEWASLRPTMVVEKAVAYDMNRSYQNKQLIQHPTFGLGIVKLLIPPNKVQVLFQDGMKLLRYQQ